MADSDELDLSLTCAICLDVASVDDVVETSCCHHLFCSGCIESVRTCPSCRQENFRTNPAHFARRLIGNLKVLCPNDGCTTKISRSDLADHLAIHCAFRQWTCPDPQCRGFKCVKQSFLKHLTSKHEQLLFDNFQKLWQTQEDIGRVTMISSKVTSRAGVEAAASNGNVVADDRIERTRNRFGRYARLGSNGKFYCKGALDGIKCSCCNGRCGPLNGCNCSACMLLDVQKRQLSRGWLVNREGASARCSREEPTKFYCGRMVMRHDLTTDGYCGPTNGEQCSACQTLTVQHQQRYGQIWNS